MVSYSRRVWGAAWLCTQGFKQCIKQRGYTPGGFQSKTVITSNSKWKWKKGITDSTLNAVGCWTCSIIYTPSIAWGGVCRCVGSKAPPPFSISFMHLMKSESLCWYQCLEEDWNLHDLDLGLCRAGLISLGNFSWLQAGRTAQLRQSWEPPGLQAFSLFLFCYQTNVLDS